MFVCCECCVLSGTGLCDELITRPEESYGLWCVVVCDLETSWMRRPWTALGRSATGKKIISRVRCAACAKLLVSVVLLLLELGWGWGFSVHLYFCMFLLSVYGAVAPRFSSSSLSCLLQITPRHIITLTFRKHSDNFYAGSSSLILVWPFWVRIPESLPTKVVNCVVLIVCV